MSRYYVRRDGLFGLWEVIDQDGYPVARFVLRRQARRYRKILNQKGTPT